MSEFESRGPTYAGPVAATGSLASQPREVSPQDRAREAIGAVTRRVAGVRATLAAMTAAHAANDLARWKEARDEADLAIGRAERQIEQARSQLRDAPVGETTALEAAAIELVAESAAIRHAEPPAGYLVIELEREVLAALRAPSVAGFAGRRDAVHAQLEQLSIADLRVLRARIASPQPQDELAVEIWKLGRALRQEVASFIENVDRRKARERAAAARGAQPAPAPEPETVDTTLRRAVEGGNVEAELLAVIAMLDGSGRRALAMRLRTYRPGSGDDIAARFATLDFAVRQRVLVELASERLTSPMGPPLAAHPDSVFARREPALLGPTAADIATQVDRAVDLATGLLAPQRPTFEAYLKRHEHEAWGVVARYLERTSFPLPSPRAAWRDSEAFAAATVAKLGTMHLFDRREALLEVLYPANPYAALATLVPDGDAWVPTVGSALGQLFEQAIFASIARLGPRWVDLAEHHPDPAGLADENQPLVAAASLLSSAPIDRAVREGMTAGGVLALVGVTSEHDNVRPLRPVTLEWQGARDPQMWNWVRVSSPRDATVEEVAAALWTSEHATEHAYGLTVSGSFFGLPASWARQFAAAKAFAPKGQDATASEQLVHLAAGTHADELALDAAAHAPRVKPEPGSVTSLLDDVRIQLGHLVQLFAPWGLDADIATAIRWVTGKQHELALAHDDERATWAPIIADQKERVYRITEAVRAFAASPKSPPIKRLLALYARATATSFLGAASERLIASAVQEQTMLTLGAVRASTNDLAVVVGDGIGLDSTQVARAEELASEAHLLQTRTLAGKAVDPDDVERLTLSTQELALHLRIEQARNQLRALSSAAAQATEGNFALAVSAFPGRFHDLPSMTAAFENHLQMVESSWTYDVSGVSQIRDPDEYGREMLKLRRAALATAQARFATIRTDDGLTTFLKNGASVIEHELRVVGWVTACVQLLVLIGVSMIASGAGSAVAETIAGWGASAEAVEGVTMLARATRTLGQLGGLATEAAINTAGQRMFKQPGDDTSFVEGMAENALMSIGSNVILSRIGSSVEFAKDIERSTGSLWASTKVAGAVMLAKGVTITSHVIINAATAYVAHQIVKRGHAEPSNATLTEWFMQGAAVAIGRYVHGQISGRRELYTKLAALHELEGAKRLLRDGDALLAHATAVEASPNDHDALELLARQRALLSDEIAVLEAAASDPAKVRALELAAPTLRGMKRFAQATLVELDATNLTELPLRSAHLDELVPGEVWKGTPAQIEAAIAAAGRAGMPVEAARGADGVWHIKLGAREVTVHEATPSEPPKATRPSAHHSEHGRWSSTEREEIRELDARSQELEDARAHAPERVAELEQRVATLEHTLGIAGEGASEARRNAVEIQREVLADAPRRAAIRQALDGERGHPGVELHSHFMGIVEPDVFRQRAATVGGANDTGSWRPLLEKIASLPDLEAAHYRAAGKSTYESEYQHRKHGGSIEHRAKGGDAVEIAIRAAEQVDELGDRAKQAKTPEDQAAFLRAAEVVAEEASRTALTSTPETPFDGAYVIIDALVKTTFGGGARPGEAPQEAEQRAFDDYIEQALLRLAETGTTYSEQSMGINKLAGKVSPDRIAMIHERLILEGRIQRGRVELKLLGMVKTRNYGEREAGMPSVGDGTQSVEEARAQNAKVLASTAHPSTLGRDVGGPEAYTFNRAGVEQYKRDYHAMVDRAVKTGHAQVDRPHVGEGSVDTQTGKPFHTDKDRVLRGDKPAHYDRASANLEQLLTAAEELRAEGVWDPTKVITRYGHATHATPAQAARMRALGIVAEVNLGSNVATGSLSQTEGPQGPRAKQARYRDHSLASLIYYDTSIVLSTDGPAVMATTLAAEYVRAYQIIEAVLAGEQPIRVSEADAILDGKLRGIPVADGPGQRALYIEELTPTERARFLSAYEKLYADAQDYLLRRPKPAGPSRHHTTIALDHALVSTLGEAQFSGTKANVLATARAYRAAGYTVIGDDVRPGESLHVAVSIGDAFTTTLLASDPPSDYTRSVPP